MPKPKFLAVFEEDKNFLIFEAELIQRFTYLVVRKKVSRTNFLARATVGTSLYVSLRQLVS